MFYDDGWNAFINGAAFNSDNSTDWKNGWLDCQVVTMVYGTQNWI